MTELALRVAAAATLIWLGMVLAISLSVLGTPVKVESVVVFLLVPRRRPGLVGGGPWSGVKVERPQRSEDERP
jgi:hypothetical protein